VGEKNASYDISLYTRTLFREPSLVQQIIGAPVNPNNTFSFQEERSGGRINLSNPLDVDRTRILLAGYRNERAKLFQRDSSGVLSAPVTSSGAPLQSSGTVSALSLGFQRDKRDSRADPPAADASRSSSNRVSNFSATPSSPSLMWTCAVTSHCSRVKKSPINPG
jgi:outer membrane protein assembly factor BamA